MPVTFQVAKHDANAIALPGYKQGGPQSPVEDLLKESCYKQWKESGEILQSSVTDSALPTLRSNKNGFVHTVVEAHGRHHHLRIRPDDVWIAILSQLSFYVNKHADELREYFVAHEGKKELWVYAVGTRYTVDFGRLARQMSDQIHQHVVDKTLVEWILPDFTTSTTNDTTICAILLMSTLQAYFSYGIGIICGIPSVTLEGEKADWERLYKRLDRLPELGEEPEQWAAMLRPILRRFVEAFDGQPDIPFWEHVVNRNDRICGLDLISGWITAFCVWDQDGKWLARNRRAGSQSLGSIKTEGNYTLDGIPYFELDMKDIPSGYGDVNVLVDDNGTTFDCKMVAGHVAATISKSSDDGVYDTLSPAPQWFMYVKGDKPRRGYEEEEAEKLARLMRDFEVKWGKHPARS
ncbi:hypothetical protein BD310DRAFT_880490 [Dichomitus squalens]|uniref:Uncharacterized protein n=1 Tax=Dichomitus squalens TaxID=114155 RepID=A0A4Q9PTA2_9APHY|nr:hypothetical protein BD310DRAFT_880490 [Dichomitus squalens]